MRLPPVKAGISALRPVLARGEHVARFGPAMTDATVPNPPAPGAAKRTFIIFMLAGLSLLAVTAALSVLWASENAPRTAVEAPAQ